MSKIIIALLIVTMIGGGAVFADYNSDGGILGLNSDPDINETNETVLSEDENPESNGDTTTGDNSENENSTDNDENNNEVEPDNGEPEGELENNLEESEDQRSEVAKAVHKALSGSEDITPGNGNDFGKAVSDRARDGDVNLGEEVSKAAREANGSLDVDKNDENGELEEGNDVIDGNGNGNSNENGINSGSSLFNNSSNNGNPGNAGGNGSPGNSGNRGNSGNAGGGRPGN